MSTQPQNPPKQQRSKRVNSKCERCMDPINSIARGGHYKTEAGTMLLLHCTCAHPTDKLQLESSK